MSDIRYMNIDDACSYLVEATNNVIHDFDMSVVLSEYKYLRDYGHEMPLTEGTFTGIKEKIREWTDKVRDWIRDIYDRVIEWIQDKLEEFRRWWLRLGLNKKDADAAKELLKKAEQRNTSDGKIENKDVNYKSLKASGILCYNLGDCNTGIMKILKDAIKSDVTLKVGSIGDDINDTTLGSEIDHMVDTFFGNNRIYVFSDNDAKSGKDFSGWKDVGSQGVLYSKADSTPNFIITGIVYDAAYAIIFETKSAVISPLEKQKREAIRVIEDEIRQIKDDRFEADSHDRGEYTTRIRGLKIKIKTISKICSKAIKLYKDSYATAAKVVKIGVSVYKTWKNKKAAT